MNCRDVREKLLEVAVEGGGISSEIQSHCLVCDPCALEAEQIKRTMALLDEWQAPEPSPYFDVRLQARLREEQQKPAADWFGWFRKPAAVGLAATVLLALGVGSFLGRQSDTQSADHAAVATVRGTAVSDLQYLDKHSDLLQEFEALDVLENSDSRGAAN
jgi:negative regulator of sigma E activity